MKSYFTTFILSVLFLASTFTASFAQIDWTKYPNPVMGPGPSGSWDDKNVNIACVILLNDTLHMWYDGNWDNNVNNGVGHARSVDGVTWIKDTLNPVLTPGPSFWDSYIASQAAVIFNTSDSLFHMWYAGRGNGNTYQPIYIGHATSPDGSSWTKDTNPVLSPGSPGSWDDDALVGPCVILVNNTLHMWYDGFKLGSSLLRIGHAISTDGIIWQKDPASPVLNIGSSQDWDYPRVRASKVIHDGSTFHLYYAGGSHPTYDVGYAYSHDGTNWIKYDDPNTTSSLYVNSDPVLTKGPPDSWDDYGVFTGSVLFNDTGDSLRTWYTGIINEDWDGYIGYAAAPIIIDALFEFDFVGENDSLMYQFTDKSIGIITNWLWEFGDGNSSNERYPMHIYIQVGTYTATLTVSGPFGSDSSTQEINVVSGLAEQSDNILKEFTLDQNYPNPFNPSTKIEFTLPKTEFVTLKIYNLLGQKVTTLVSEKLNAGSYNYSWDAGTLSSGVYLYKLNAGKLSQIRKMILLR